MRYILLINILIMGLFGACNSIMVDDVKKGKKLDKAEKVLPNAFFQDRMTNRVRKAPVGYWEVIHTDEEYLYYGWPSYKRILSEKRELKEFYKVDIKELTDLLPNYEFWQGFKLRLLVLNDLDVYYKEKYPDKKLSSFECTLKYRLKNKEIYVDVYLPETSEPSFMMQLNPLDGHALSFKEL